MGNEEYVDEDLFAELSDEISEPDISSFDMSSAENIVSENTGFPEGMDELSSDEAFSRIGVSTYKETEIKDKKTEENKINESKADKNKAVKGSDNSINKTRKNKTGENKACENGDKDLNGGVKYTGCDDSVDEFIKQEVQKNEEKNKKKDKNNSGNRQNPGDKQKDNNESQKDNQAENNTEKPDRSGFSEDAPEEETDTAPEFDIYSDCESKSVVDDPYLYYMSNYKKVEEMCAECHYKNNFHSCGECKSKQEADYYKKAYKEAADKDNSAEKKNSPKVSEASEAPKESADEKPKDFKLGENPVLSVFSNPDVKKIGIYIASVAAIILSLVLISCFTKSSSKTKNVQNEKFVKNSESISEKDNTAMYSNAAEITNVLFSDDETYESAYTEAYGSVGNVSSSRFETLDDLTFYLNSNFDSILADEKLLVNKLKSGEIKQREFMNEMNSYISETDNLNHLLISNRETYNLEGKSSEYDSLSEKADTVIMYGDSAVYINCK